MHSAAVSALGLHVTRFPLIPWIFSLYYEMWMVNDLNYLQSCTEKHCLWTDSHKSWHKVVNPDPSKTKAFGGCLYFYTQPHLLPVKLQIVEPSRTVSLVTFSFLFCLLSQLFECVAGVPFCCFLYLQNTIRVVSEHTENVFSVLLAGQIK